MSRRKDNYEHSRWLKFRKWVDGEIDPLANGMEIRVPQEVDRERQTRLHEKNGDAAAVVDTPSVSKKESVESPASDIQDAPPLLKEVLQLTPFPQILRSDIPSRLCRYHCRSLMDRCVSAGVWKCGKSGQQRGFGPLHRKRAS